MKLCIAIVAVSFNQCLAQETRTLDYYISAAILNSPLLHEYQNQILAARIDSQLIQTNYKPQINAITNNIYAPMLGGHGYDQAITNGGTFSTLITVSKTFIGRNNINTQYRSARLGADSAINTTKISEQEIKRTVTAQYLAAYGDQQQLINNKRINGLLRQEESIFKKLTQHNIYRQTDYLTFLVTFKQQELQMRQAELQYQTDYANLNYLCGIIDTDANNVVLADPLLKLPSLPDPTSSAFFYKYFLDSLRLQNDIALVRLNYRPRFSIFGDAGYNSSQIAFYRYYGFSAGFSVTVPIYDGHKKCLNIAKIDLLEDTRLHYKSFFTAQYSQQIAQFTQQLRNTEKLLTEIEEQVKYTETLIGVNERLMQTGDIKISDFVIAINNYLAAQYLVTQNRINRYQIINQINYWNR